VLAFGVILMDLDLEMQGMDGFTATSHTRDRTEGAASIAGLDRRLHRQ
jgi:CheY-like chemotaxis protein